MKILLACFICLERKLLKEMLSVFIKMKRHESTAVADQDAARIPSSGVSTTQRRGSALSNIILQPAHANPLEITTNFLSVGHCPRRGLKDYQSLPSGTGRTTHVFRMSRFIATLSNRFENVFDLVVRLEARSWFFVSKILVALKFLFR